MYEKKQGVKRLLNSIYQNVDAGNIKVFAQILNYEESQLMQDIESIDLGNSTILEKDLRDENVGILDILAKGKDNTKYNS